MAPRFPQLFDLANKGLRLLSPEPPRSIQSTDYAQRIVACGAQLLYPVLFGDKSGLIVAGAGDGNLGSTGVGGFPVVFFQLESRPGGRACGWWWGETRIARQLH